MKFLVRLLLAGGRTFMREFRSPLERTTFIRHHMSDEYPDALLDATSEEIDADDEDVRDEWFENSKETR